MIAAGFLAGALACVVKVEQVLWTYFVPAVALGTVGVVFVRLGQHRRLSSGTRLAADMGAIDASLGRIVENITRLNEQKNSIDTYDIRHRIDELFPEDLAGFVQARQSIAQVHGLTAYAEVMSSFAAGERYLNRVWSASADGYVDEVNEYLERARAQFTDSLEKVRRLQASP